jgi:hypothetical protein
MRTVKDFPDIDPSDLVDTVNTPRPARFSKWAIVAACALGVPLAAVALVLGSLPEMSPADIVQMEGYAGRQQAKPVALAPAPAPASVEKPLQQVQIAGLEVVEATADEPPVDVNAADNSFREIAAATQTVEKPLVGSVSATNDAVNYPVLQVKRQYSNVRSGPSTRDQILTSLEIGSTVTVFDRRGDWLQIGVNDDSSITGFIHKSLLGVIPPGSN